MKLSKVLKRVGASMLCCMLLFSSVAFQPIVTRADIAGVTDTTINYQGQTVSLSEHALYVNANLEPSCEYAFKTIQGAVAAAKPGTKDNPTVIYLEPNVYWTDDYTKTEVRSSDDLIGLLIPQSYVSLVGMTGNPADVVIASDRGQNAGANGNFNTIGVADGFHAKDITIGNYCNVDLNYALDPNKSHTKRQESVTQAQAVTKVPGITDMDEWYFEHCNIISRLNLFSRDERPQRSLLKDCHLECTDDSLGTGYITIFQNCTFDLYSNTPCGGASFYMQAYLGCQFTTHLTDNKIITLCKNTKPFTFIDCAFNGDMTGMEWKQSNFSSDIRQIVSGNTLNGSPLMISPSMPQLSVTPDAEQMKSFKFNGDYNIYNLLNGAGYEEWDPLNQKASMPVGTWNIQFDYAGITKDVVPSLEGNTQASLEVSPIVLGGIDKTVTWSVEDSTLSIEPQSNGNVIVKGTNNTSVDKVSSLIATAGNGMKKVLHFTVTPMIVAPPEFVQVPELLAPADGKIKVQYSISGSSDIRDTSLVKWYRGSLQDGSDKVLVAQTTYVTPDATPNISYELHLSDIGSYVFCEIIPQRASSEAGNSVMTIASKKIQASDVSEIDKTTYDVDLEHLAYIEAENDTAANNFEWLTSLKSGNWYGGFYLPVEYRAGGIWSDKIYSPSSAEEAYTFAAGSTGAAGIYGFQTTTQGARLVYVDDTARKDMKMTIELSPHKTAAQGFGSAKQFMDIYFKYDAATMTGYGLRIARVPDIADPLFADYAAKSCTFTLMEYKNGVPTPLEAGVISTAFLPGCSITLDMTGNVLKVDVITSTPQDSAYPKEMLHEVHISHVFTDIVNSYSGFGFQHTGTAGTGKSGNRTTIESVKLEYGNYDNQVIDNPVVDINTGNVSESSNSDSSVATINTGDSTSQIIIFYSLTLLISSSFIVITSKKRLTALKKLM